MVSKFLWHDEDVEIEYTKDEKQLPEPTPRGRPLPDWDGQVEITPDDVADAVRDWNRKVEDEEARDLLLTERPEGG